jgi:uncharacterized protein DUF3301
MLIALLAVAWLWHDNMQAREVAIASSRNACLRAGLQLLDDTVALASLRPARDARGRVALRRVYVFEFTDTGDNRRHGTVVVVRAVAVGVELEPYRIQ